MTDMRRKGGISGALAAKAIDKIAAKRIEAITAQEKRIDESTPKELVHGKNCHFISADSIAKLEVKETYSPTAGGMVPLVTVKASRKFKFRFLETPKDQVHAFFQPWQRG